MARKNLVKIIVNCIINLHMNKALIKLSAKKILFDLTEQEMNYIEKKYSLIDEKIKELMTIDLKNYKPTFTCAINSNYQFRQDVINRSNNEKIIVKKIFLF